MGITPILARKQGAWLEEIGIDGIEISSGSVGYNMMSCRGDFPIDKLFEKWPAWKKILLPSAMRMLAEKHSFEEGYNLVAARELKCAVKKAALILVGGLRNTDFMRGLIEQGEIDFISMSRPFIREPMLVKKIREGKQDASTCTSCNKCLVSIFNSKPLRCSYDS